MHARFYSFLSVTAFALGVFFLSPLVTQASFYPGQTTDPNCLPSDPTCVISSVASSTANSIPYYASNGSVLSATSTFQILANGTASTSGATLSKSTLTGTTTNSDTISGGTINSYITQHCTTITDYNSTSSVIPSGGGFTKVIMDTVLNDPDTAADLANSQIKVPSWAKHVQVSGHIDFPVQNNGNGYASLHLFRRDAYTPEAYYHVRTYYPATTTPGNYISIFASSPVIPITYYLGTTETWQLYAWQNSGASVDVATNFSGPASWLEVCFYP